MAFFKTFGIGLGASIALAGVLAGLYFYTQWLISLPPSMGVLMMLVAVAVIIATISGIIAVATRR